MCWQQLPLFTVQLSKLDTVPEVLLHKMELSYTA